MLLLVGAFSSSCIVSGDLGEAGETTATTVDTTAPSAATALGWTEPAAHDSTTINASWTISASLDLKTQTITLYDDGTCTGTVIATDATIDHTTSTTQFTAGDGVADLTTYSYTINSTDESANSTISACSSAIAINSTFVASATGLTWLESTPNNTTTATAQWTISTAADLFSQSISLYTDAACTALDVGPVVLGAAVTSYAFTLADTNTRYFQVLSTDDDTNDSSANPDNCSAIMQIDTSAPADATAISWTEGTTANSTTVNADWTESASGDVAYQQIELHDAAACASAVAGKGYTDNGNIAVGTSTLAFAGLTDGSTYSYNIKIVDTAGNSSFTCSSAIAIDTTTPAAPTSLGWNQTSPHKDDVDADANWTLSASGDVTQQQIRYYNDATCTTSIDIGDGLGVWTSIGIGVNTHTYLSVGVGTSGVTYYYQTRVTDAATNLATSSCSSGLEIDTDIPAEPVTNLGSSTNGTIASGGLMQTVWTKSVASDVAYQIVNYWSDAICTTLVSTSIVGSASETHSANPAGFTPAGASDNTYYFTIIAVDAADNQVVAPTNCTGPLQYDVAVPTGATVSTATGAAWASDAIPTMIATDYYDGLTIRAIWTASVDPDLDYEVINYYTDSSCATTAVVTYGSSGSSAATTDNNLATTLAQSDNGTTYYFRITTYDDVGNSTVSTNCSTEMEIRLSQLKLVEDAAIAGDTFGSSVAIYGTIAVLGSPLDVGGIGSVSIFEKSGGAWSETTTIFGNTSCGAAAGAHFGAAVAIDVNTIIIGMPDSGTGFACIYKKVTGTWTYQTKLSPFGAGTASGDQFGSSVAISGATAIVGAPAFNTNEGAAYLFEDSGTWGSVSALAPSCTGFASSTFGTSVSIDGIVAVVGAPECTDGGASSGSVFFFEYDGLSWNEDQVEDGAASDTFGTSVDIDGTRTVIGAPGNTTAYIYNQIVSWTEDAGSPLTPSAAGQGFGTSVAISGNAIAIGAPLDDVATVDNGALFIFEYTGVWTEEIYRATDQATLDQFGSSVDIFSETAVIGAPIDDTSKGAGYIQLIN